MKVRAIVLGVLLVLVVAFTLANWPAISATTQVSLLVGHVEASIGFILLTFLVVVSGVFLFLMVVQQAGMIRETRRFSKELAAQRTLADQAEASRFTELREFIGRRLDRLDAGGGGASEEPLTARIDRLETALREHIDRTGNTLAAYIGEVDDRVERLVDSNPPRS
jgi:biopolymer transport protein ExbB/TolQ